MIIRKALLCAIFSSRRRPRVIYTDVPSAHIRLWPSPNSTLGGRTGPLLLFSCVWVPLPFGEELWLASISFSSMPIGNIAGVGGFTSFPWLVEELTTEVLQTIGAIT